VVLACPSPSSGQEAKVWCAAKCEKLFQEDPPKPVCELWRVEHGIENGKIKELHIPIESCWKKVELWEKGIAQRDKMRSQFKDAKVCLAWCNKLAELRAGQPFTEDEAELTDILRSIVLCNFEDEYLPDINKVPLDIGCPGMAWVQAGSFWMGCNEPAGRGRPREKPYHVVYLDGYFMDRHEVTVAGYRRCVEASWCDKPLDSSVLKYYNWGFKDRDHHPVNGVNWYQASAYCEWAGKRLCSEAEWEKGARGIDGREYPWGSEMPSNGYVVIDHGVDFSEDGRGWPVLSATAPVCSRPAGNSPYDLCDLAGNVWEWVGDWFTEEYYKTSPTHNPVGPRKGSRKVIRGGRFFRIGFSLRACSRSFLSPEKQFVYLGFRCCKSP